MRYKLFGKSGLRVSELALGTMTFGEDWGWGADKETSKEIFDAYAEAGGNFIDTANRYTNGTSEKYVGEFVAADRDYKEIEKTALGQVMLGPGGMSPSDLIGMCRGLAEIGMDTFIFSIANVHDIAPIETIGREVIPVVAEF